MVLKMMRFPRDIRGIKDYALCDTAWTTIFLLTLPMLWGGGAINRVQIYIRENETICKKLH